MGFQKNEMSNITDQMLKEYEDAGLISKKMDGAYSLRDKEWLKLVSLMKHLDSSEEEIMLVCKEAKELIDILEVHKEILSIHYQGCYQCIDDIDKKIIELKKN